MFTGLITDIGQVHSLEGGNFDIACSYDLDDDAIGASIACDGCCLTVTGTKPGPDGFKSLFSVDVSNETLEHTTLGAWEQGRKINLERSLTPASEIGGHIVTGHVDTAAEITERSDDGESVRFTINVDERLARFIAPKGSVALSGVSLTINEVEGNQFGINLIPHTLAVTNWGHAKIGNEINLEVDLLARYVARITQFNK
jgi:riboflavin synthase